MIENNIVITEATDKEGIQKDFDLLDYCVHLADGSRGTVVEQQYNYSSESYVNPLNPDVTTSNTSGTGPMNRSVAMDTGSIVIGKTLTKPITDPIHIFKIEKNTRDSAIKKQELQRKELVKQAEKEYEHFATHTKYENQFDIDGTHITREFYVENPVRCKWCSKRFSEEKDRKHHSMRTHGTYS
jgi:hypothetical protein